MLTCPPNYAGRSLRAAADANLALAPRTTRFTQHRLVPVKAWQWPRVPPFTLVHSQRGTLGLVRALCKPGPRRSAQSRRVFSQETSTGDFDYLQRCDVAVQRRQGSWLVLNLQRSRATFLVIAVASCFNFLAKKLQRCIEKKTNGVEESLAREIKLYSQLSQALMPLQSADLQCRSE